MAAKQAAKSKTPKGPRKIGGAQIASAPEGVPYIYGVARPAVGAQVEFHVEGVTFRGKVTEHRQISDRKAAIFGGGLQEV